MMRRALVIADLEGITGVDAVASIAAMAPGFPAACRSYSDEVATVAGALLEAGYAEVRVVDSHRAGLRGPNLEAARMPPGVPVLVRADSYSAALLAGVDAVACVGMHAPAGSPGFAAHTMDLHCAWLADSGPLSESDVVAALAAEADVPMLFVSGDDVLGEHLRGSVPYVETKSALGVREATSHAASSNYARLRAAAANPPVAVARRAPRLRLRCKRAWQAAECQRAGATRVDAHTVEIEAATFRAAYDRARAAVALSAAPLRPAIIHASSDDTLAALVECLVAPFAGEPPLAQPEAAARSLAAFLARTDGDLSWQRADRALTLRAIRALAPTWFRTQGLAPVLDDAFLRLRRVPVDFVAGLSPVELMARVDALYLARLHALHHDAPTGHPADVIEEAVRRLPGIGWLIGELGAAAGLLPRPSIDPRALRDRVWVQDMYCATHLILLATRFGELPYGERDASLLEELALAMPRVVREQRVDLAAEIALCLQLAGERCAGETRDALALVATHQQADGSVRDPSTAHVTGPEAQRLEAHATATALLMWSAGLERAAP